MGEVLYLVLFIPAFHIPVTGVFDRILRFFSTDCIGYFLPGLLMNEPKNHDQLYLWKWNAVNIYINLLIKSTLYSPAK